MKYERDRTWAEVSLDHLASNFQKLSEWTGPACDVLCVVKGNAYGHGAIEVSRELERVGCKILGVATLEEACSCNRRIRVRSGISPELHNGLWNRRYR